MRSAPREKGKNLFQVKSIRRSYRIRGKVPRIHTNVNARKRVFKVSDMSGRISGGEVKKNTELNSLIIRMLVYSAMKIKAKGPLLYSVLNPDTSSDSPSAKSKGVRFVSAKVVVNQIKNKGTLNKIMGVH